MNIDRNKLTAILKKCLPGIETKDNLLQGADTFTFDKGFVHTYNDNISISVKLDDQMKKLKGAIKAKELFNVLFKIKQKEIQIVLKEKSWIIKAGAARVELNLNEDSVSDFITGLDISGIEFKDTPKNFREGLKCVKLSCNATAFAGVFVSDKIMMATDGSKLNWFDLSGSMEKFWISDPSVGELLKFFNLEKYSISKSWLHFLSGSIYFSCRRLSDQNYPFEKCEKLVESQKQKKEDISGKLPSTLIASVDRASALAMEIGDEEGVRLTLSKEGIEIFSERSTGKYKEKIEWDKNGTPNGDLSEGVQLYIDHSILAYGLARSPEFYIKKSESSGRIRIVFYGQDFIHIASLISSK